jgi:hypothetical protein
LSVVGDQWSVAGPEIKNIGGNRCNSVFPNNGEVRRARISSQDFHARLSETVFLTIAFNDFPTVTCDLARMGVSRARRGEQVRVHCSSSRFENCGEL